MSILLSAVLKESLSMIIRHDKKNNNNTAVLYIIHAKKDANKYWYVCGVDGGISSERYDRIESLGPWTGRRHLDVN